MAITAIEYSIFSALRQQQVLPPAPRVLELGEANWYGDVPLQQLVQDIRLYVSDEPARNRLLTQIQHLADTQTRYWLFDLAKIFYTVFLNYSSITAIDLHGTPAALRYDLNYPVHLDTRFDMVLNLGTAEHIFNVFQFFKTVHDLTAPGGLMVHGMPFTGWYDHGFYNFQPTFYWDLALQNRYTILALIYAQLSPFSLTQLHTREQISKMVTEGQIAPNALLYAVFRKGDEEQDFLPPMQGYYAGILSETCRQAWHKLR